LNRGDTGRYLKLVTDEERFMAKVSPCPITGCWWWLAGVDQDGYGRFTTGNSGHQRQWSAPRFALIVLAGVDLAPGQVAMHSCDNGGLGCTNPDHLKPGTPVENRADCVAKGRQARGEAARHAKLTPAKVIELRALAATGVGPTALGLKFGITKATACQVRDRRTWGHVA
jgi:hypothetical protein